MRQSRVFSTVAKRLIQSRSLEEAPMNIAPVIFSTRSSGWIHRHSQPWMGYGSLYRHWQNPLLKMRRFSSVASPESSSKEAGESAIFEGETAVNGNDIDAVSNAEAAKKSAGKSGKSKEDLMTENEQLKDALEDREMSLEEKDKTLAEVKDRLLRSYAEVENVMERARRESGNSQKFAIQNFVKGLLPVADNLGRAAAAVPEGFCSSDSSGSPEAEKLLGSLLEGVKMTEKELLQVLKKFGVQKFEPTGEPFDPNVHLAICEVQDPEKQPGSIAVVFKPGYMLHERVIRPAEVAVVKDATK